MTDIHWTRYAFLVAILVVTTGVDDWRHPGAPISPVPFMMFSLLVTVLLFDIATKLEAIRSLLAQQRRDATGHADD
jgi:hypothetical protein